MSIERTNAKCAEIVRELVEAMDNGTTEGEMLRRVIGKATNNPFTPAYMREIVKLLDIDDPQRSTRTNNAIDNINAATKILYSPPT